MRASVLSILAIALLALASDAHAQTPMDDPYTEQTYGPRHADFRPAFDYPHIWPARDFQKIQALSFDERGRPMLQAGNGWYLRTRGETYRPFETIGVRDEGVGLTYTLNDRFSITGGVDRSKLRLNGLPTLRTEPVYGVRLYYSF